MKIIEQSSNIWGECPAGKDEAILWVERAGRICYRSEDKIVEGSGRKFVDGIIRRGHGAVLEKSNVVFKSIRSYTNPYSQREEFKKIFNSKYLNVHIENDHIFVGGSIRAWSEHWVDAELDDLYDGFMQLDFCLVTDTKDIPLPLKRITVEFTTDRAVSHEMVRHRPCSFLQESQRYVRYDGNMRFVKPSWYDKAEKHIQGEFESVCRHTESSYRWLREHMPAEDARVVLINQNATKIAVTADLEEWNLIFGLRCSPAAYRQYRNLITPVMKEFKERGW